mgnify:CR=1 FL=1|jgi:TPR repeat protein
MRLLFSLPVFLYFLIRISFAEPVDAEVWEKQCDRNDADACFNLGLSYGPGNTPEVNHFKEFHYLEKSCIGGHALGCWYTAEAYRKGEGVRQDDHRQLEFYGLACDLELQLGCDAYAQLKQELNGAGVR